jgi:hypothetical protein
MFCEKRIKIQQIVFILSDLSDLRIDDVGSTSTTKPMCYGSWRYQRWSVRFVRQLQKII